MGSKRLLQAPSEVPERRAKYKGIKGLRNCPPVWNRLALQSIPVSVSIVNTCPADYHNGAIARIFRLFK